MANDSTEVRLAPFGSIYVGPVGTTLPTTATMALDPALDELGYVDEDGVSLTPGVDVTDIMMWQSLAPVKTTLDSIQLELKFNMGQVNQTTLGLYFFVTDFTNNFGEAKMVISSNPGSQERALVLDWTDDEGDQTRLVLPRAVLTDREDLQLVRNNAQLMGVTFRALDNSGVLAYLYSENPDLLPAS